MRNFCSRCILRCLFLISIFFSLYSSIFAATIDELTQTLNEYGIAYQANTYIENPVIIDLSPLEELLAENFWDYPLEYIWEIPDNPTQNGKILEVQFPTPGQKNINLSIVTQEEGEQIPVYESDISVFIYEQSLPMVVSSSVADKTLETFVNNAREQAIYVKILGKYSEDLISGEDLVKNIDSYQISYPKTSDYITIWGEKEFIFSTLNAISQAQNRSQKDTKYNFVLVSNYNPELLNKYILNNIAGKNFIQTAFTIDTALTYQILKQPESIEKLEIDLSQNNYPYTMIQTQRVIPRYLFFSNFVNMLANSGVTTSDIYILLLIPIYLTLVWGVKYMIGFASMGNIIPIFLAIIAIKLGIIFVGVFFLALIGYNMVLGKWLNRFTLLYTPKVAVITLMNLIFFIIVYQLVVSAGIEIPRIDNILYVILFFVMAERLIVIVTSKEFREYKSSIYGTIFIALLCYGLYYVDPLRVFLMSYPETLLVFVPLNFYIGRFTGLRITEYFRFREILKGVEE